MTVKFSILPTFFDTNREMFLGDMHYFIRDIFLDLYPDIKVLVIFLLESICFNHDFY